MILIVLRCLHLKFMHVDYNADLPKRKQSDSDAKWPGRKYLGHVFFFQWPTFFASIPEEYRSTQAPINNKIRRITLLLCL